MARKALENLIREALRLGDTDHISSAILVYADWLEENGDDHDAMIASLLRARDQIGKIEEQTLYSPQVDGLRFCTECDSVGKHFDFHYGVVCKTCGVGSEKVEKFRQRDLDFPEYRALRKEEKNILRMLAS